MEENKRIGKIQQEYHEFCLSLLNKVPAEISDKQLLAQQAYLFREELQEEISKGKILNDYYNPAINELRNEINKRSG